MKFRCHICGCDFESETKPAIDRQVEAKHGETSVFEFVCQACTGLAPKPKTILEQCADWHKEESTSLFMKSVTETANKNHVLAAIFHIQALKHEKFHIACMEAK